MEAGTIGWGIRGRPVRRSQHSRAVIEQDIDNRGRVLPNELDRAQRADIKQRTARRDRKADRARGCRTVVAIADALRFNRYPRDVGARRNASRTS
jgi:hypothetical protein